MKAICQACERELVAYEDDDRIIIEPCERCMDDAYDEGDRAGWQRGYGEGRYGITE